MSLTVVIDGVECRVRAAQLDATGEQFGLYSAAEGARSDQEVLCFVRNPLQITAEDNNPAEFRVALFTHKDWPESQVFSLKEGKSSIGLIFSLQALASETGTFRANRMWNDYGLLALAKLCAGDSCSPGFQQCVRGENYAITELYSDDTVVAIFRACDCGLESGTQDEFLAYLYDRIPGFVRLGLFLQAQEGSGRVRPYKSNGLLKQLAQTQSNLRVRRFASEFPSNSKKFLVDLMVETDPYEGHPAFRFFLYYQVIESLLQDMFEEYYREFVRLAGDPRFNRATAMKDLVAHLNDALSEKARLNVLVHANSSSGAEFGILRDHCRRVLDILVPTSPLIPATVQPVGAAVPQPVTPGSVQATPTAPPALEDSAGAPVAPAPAQPAELVAAQPVTPGSVQATPTAPPALEDSAGAPVAPAPAQPAELAIRQVVTVQAAISASPGPEDAAALLYSVRNVLFHSFSRVSSREDLDELVEQFSLTICDLALNYTKPAVKLSG